MYFLGPSGVIFGFSISSGYLMLADEVIMVAAGEADVCAGVVIADGLAGAGALNSVESTDSCSS